MQEIILFENEEFGQLRMIFIEGKQYFMANDVAKALGYTNPNKAINDHCRAITKRYTPISGKEQEVNFISEGDVYRLIIRSKLPKAEEFEKWVFDEVLPSIRKTGGYTSNINIQEAIQQVVFETIKAVVPEVMKAVTSEMIPFIMEQQKQEAQQEHAKKERRTTSIISRLNFETRKAIEDMMCSGMYTYAEITKILNENGIKISLTSVHRYAQSIGL